MTSKTKAAQVGLLTDVRNMGIFAHVDAGKTTCTERILFYSGETHRLGDVDDGNTVTDFNEQEQERGITIFSAAVTSHWNGHTINLIDTPGHVDFTMEVERSMRVLDGGVLVVCAKGGVQPQTRTVWKQANRYNVPRLVFINKMDATGANFQRALQSLTDNLTSDSGTRPIAMQIPIGEADKFVGVVDLIKGKAIIWDASDPSGATFTEEPIPAELADEAEVARSELVEAIVETDDELLERYLEDDQSISDEELIKALRKACISLKVVPVFCGTAHKSKGIQPLLDAIISYLPSPVETPAVVGEKSSTGEKVERKADSNEPLAALVFKVVSEVHGNLFYTRVYSGKIESGSYVWNSTKGTKERVSRIVKMQGNKRAESKALLAGDIGVLMGLKSSTTGDTLCPEGQDLLLESIVSPEPVISMAVEAQSQDDNSRLGNALARLASEDPSFHVKRDEETGQVIIAGQGELHLQVMIERLKREDKVIASTGRPQVSYRETIRQAATADKTFKRQSGGRGMFARVVLTIEPMESGAGFEFVDKVVGGAIPREYISSVEKGVKEAMATGSLTSSPIVDVRVTVTDGSYHDVDSNDQAFMIAASMAFKEAFGKANPVLLEPVMDVEIELPDEFMGNIIGDLNQRRGQVKGSDMSSGETVVKASVPLVEMFGYSSVLRNASKGEGLFSMEFASYEPVPDSVASELVQKT